MKNKIQEFETFYQMLKTVKEEIQNLDKKYGTKVSNEEFIDYNVEFYRRNINISNIYIPVKIDLVKDFRKEINLIYEKYEEYINILIKTCDIRGEKENFHHEDRVHFFYAPKEDITEEIESIFKNYVEDEQEDYIRLEVFLVKEDTTYEGMKALFTKEKYEKFSKEIFEKYLEKYKTDEIYFGNIKRITIYL